MDNLLGTREASAVPNEFGRSATPIRAAGMRRVDVSAACRAIGALRRYTRACVLADAVTVAGCATRGGYEPNSPFRETGGKSQPAGRDVRAHPRGGGVTRDLPRATSGTPRDRASRRPSR